MTTKKMPVNYDASRPESGSSDFLAVVFENAVPVFFGLRSKRIRKSGRMVYLGQEITENDVFARLVDSGRKIENVEPTLKVLADYVQQLGNFKISNIITVVPKGTESGFELVKVTEMPKITPRPLP